MDHRHRALLTNNAAMLLYGLSAVLIGPTLPGMVSRFNLSLSAAGLIGSLQSAGGLVGAVAAFWVADRVSRPTATIVLFALVGVTLLGIGITGSYPALLAAFAAWGFFVRLFDVMLNAHTGELVRGDSGRGLSTLHMFFSIGAFVGPVAARGLMRAGLSWSGVFLTTGAAYGAALVVSVTWLRGYLRTGSPAAHPAHHRPPGERPDETTGTGGESSRTMLVIALLGALLFFYAIHQIGMTAWLPYFLEHARGASPDLASAGLSLYWVGIIGGRFLASRTVRRLGAGTLLTGGAFLSAIASAAAVTVPLPVVGAIFAAIAGVTSGATIPLAYAVGFTLVPSRTGRVTAVMSVIMLAGRLLGPWMIGAVADRWSLPPAMMIPAGVLVVSGLLAVVATRVPRR